MRKKIVAVVFLLISCSFVWPQNAKKANGCADPSSKRVGIIIGPGDDTSDPFFVRMSVVEKRFAEALAKRWKEFCIIHTLEPFADPANYPILSGTAVFIIHAWPSKKNPQTAAIAVNLEAAYGPTLDKMVGITAFPILIEEDTEEEYAYYAALVEKRIDAFAAAAQKLKR